MFETVDKISQIIDTYEGGEWQTSEKLRVLLRELTTSIYRLTKYDIEYHNKHNAIQYNNKGSVASGLILANEQVPELRMCRKIIESANRVVGSMTMELSIIKNESK